MSISPSTSTTTAPPATRGARAPPGPSPPLGVLRRRAGGRGPNTFQTNLGALAPRPTGISTYLYLGGRQSHVSAAPLNPTLQTPSPRAFTLPGTLFLVQDGAIYSLSAGRFHQVTTAGGWMQPSLTVDGNLLVVRKSSFYSDIFELNRFGKRLKQLTFNAAPPRSYDTGNNHWAFYPRMASDGKTVFLSYDKPKG